MQEGMIRKKGARIVLAVCAALLVVSMAVASHVTPASAATKATLDQYRAWMADAKAMYPYPQSLDKMWRVMMCESGGNASASGGGGRWQFFATCQMEAGRTVETP